METKGKIIKVEVKQIYGTERIYPTTYINELLELTGTKTLSRSHIDALKKMGFEFKVITNVSL